MICLIFFAMSWVFRLGIIHNFLKDSHIKFQVIIYAGPFWLKED